LDAGAFVGDVVGVAEEFGGPCGGIRHFQGSIVENDGEGRMTKSE
jgi:hypothetical protein